LLFVLSRVLNRMNGGDDVYWKSERLAQQGAMPPPDNARF
jgi:cob(I)alamin adenosyltransferase